MTSSRRGASAPRRRTATSALVEQTEVGELYLRGLLRAQLRLALAVLGVVATTLLGLPLLFAAVPATRELHLGPLPFPWLVLGVLLYPAMIAAAAVYSRQAERTERRFADIVTQER
ncbi:hypothetical protein GCM10011509_21400 [Ornithinimicrobium pekingense]|uniref:DUF485 domain-containing protein n=1 Tax=Ornithinimicrobium pekingense TaxID=384677 RepID=A0ABQ2FA72_9MICO|nr:hypothetical protein GCM10011509_21400 [Ornithinimicrobium pekingense]